MSTEKGLQKIERGDHITVIDVETGAAGEGETYPEALENLAELLRAISGIADAASELGDHEEGRATAERAVDSLEDMRATSEFIQLAEATRERFEAEDVDEAVIDEAIEWARSQ